MKNKKENKLIINWLIISCCAVFGLLTLTNFTTSRLDQKSVDYVRLFPEPSFDKSSFRPESAIKLSSTFERSLSSQVMSKIKRKPKLGTLEQIKAEFPDMQLDASGAAALTETIDALAELTRGFNKSETRQWSMKNGTYNCSNETSTHLAFIIPFRDESITQFRTHQLNMMLYNTLSDQAAVKLYNDHCQPRKRKNFQQGQTTQYWLRLCKQVHAGQLFRLSRC